MQGAKTLSMEAEKATDEIINKNNCAGGHNEDKYFIKLCQESKLQLKDTSAFYFDK